MKMYGKTIASMVALVAFIVWVIYIDRNGGFYLSGILWMLLIVAVLLLAVWANIRLVAEKDHSTGAGIATAIAMVVVGGSLFVLAALSMGADGFVSSISTMAVLVLWVGFSWLIARGLPSFKRKNKEASDSVTL